jgi:F-type H+-transporting ATPase subunit a
MTPLAHTIRNIDVTHYPAITVFGIGFHIGTIIAAAIGAAVVLTLAFFARAKITSSGVPSGPQLFFEALTKQMRDQVEAQVGMRVAPFVLPLSVTLFILILLTNWVSVLETPTGPRDYLIPATADVSYVAALTLVVFVWYHGAGMRRRGPLRHYKLLAKGHVAALAPFNIIEELAKPVSLTLRLFGNLYAGTVMVVLISLFPWYILWAPNFVWKLFDMFIGLIQALVYALLTILYFGQAMEDHEKEPTEAI